MFLISILTSALLKYCSIENLQRTFARYTEKTSFERPLTSGVAYAVRVLHGEREQFEIQQRWTIKRMDNVEQTPVHEDEYDPADLEPSPVQEEYAPVIFAQDTVAHVISVDMLSGKVNFLCNAIRLLEYLVVAYDDTEM